MHAFAQSHEHRRSHVGAGLLANAQYQSPNQLNDTPHSRASPLPQWTCGDLKIRVHNNNKIAALRGSPPWPHLLRRCPTMRSSRRPGNVVARSVSTT
ncbi:hypothetical protein CXF97_14725 [Pseudomonas sp. Choline-02u-1]|nr:hypothetical protein CXF97_14725 [Pseudomonas sp. Choline-02u-1]